MQGVILNGLQAVKDLASSGYALAARCCRGAGGHDFQSCRNIQETLPARLKAVPSHPRIEAGNSAVIRARDTFGTEVPQNDAGTGDSF